MNRDVAWIVNLYGFYILYTLVRDPGSRCAHSQAGGFFDQPNSLRNTSAAALLFLSTSSHRASRVYTVVGNERPVLKRRWTPCNTSVLF